MPVPVPVSMPVPVPVPVPVLVPVLVLVLVLLLVLMLMLLCCDVDVLFPGMRFSLLNAGWRRKAVLMAACGPLWGVFSSTALSLGR